MVFSLKDVKLDHGAESSYPGLGMNIARYNAGGSGWRTYGGQWTLLARLLPAPTFAVHVEHLSPWLWARSVEECGA